LPFSSCGEKRNESQRVQNRKHPKTIRSQADLYAPIKKRDYNGACLFQPNKKSGFREVKRKRRASHEGVPVHLPLERMGTPEDTVRRVKNRSKDFVERTEAGGIEEEQK